MKRLIKASDITLLQETSPSTLTTLSHITDYTIIRDNPRNLAAVILNNSSSHKFTMIHKLLLTSCLPTKYRTRVSDVILKLHLPKMHVLIISIYAHSGNYREQRLLFNAINEGIHIIKQMHRDKTIRIVMAGHFNNIENHQLDASTAKHPTQTAKKAVTALQTISKKHQLRDAFRILNPRRKHTTNRNPNNNRRLDRFYVDRKWEQYIACYAQHRRDNIKSSHDTIELDILLSHRPHIRIGKRRFIVSNKYLEHKPYLDLLKTNSYSNWEELVYQAQTLASQMRVPKQSIQLNNEELEIDTFEDLNERFRAKTL